MLVRLLLLFRQGPKYIYHFLLLFRYPLTELQQKLKKDFNTS
jgi:hypothetical protein